MDSKEVIVMLDEILLLEDGLVNEFYKNYVEGSIFYTSLNNILPELRDCYRCEQNNPWHIYDVLTHILISIQNMNRRSVRLPYKIRRELAYIMLFHDIGKPRTKVLRQAKDGTYKDTFYNHNFVSEDIAALRLSSFEFDKEEIKWMKKLIREHDAFIPLGYERKNNPHHSMEKFKNKMINELSNYGDGETLFQYLIWVGLSDSGAQNPLFAKNAIIMLEELESL